MAILYPCTPPDFPFSERKVFLALQQALPEREFSIFYDVTFALADRNLPRQIDFIIVHPMHGCLFLEVKGGTIGYSDTEGWYTIPYNSTEKEPLGHHGPYHQVVGAAALFARTATEQLGWSRTHFRWGVGVVLPNTTIAWKYVRLPPEAKQSLTADQLLVAVPAKLREWVLRRYSEVEREHSAAGQNFSRYCNELIERYLVPRFESGVKLAALIAENRNLEYLLSEAQRGILTALSHRPRALISGFAGTGKSFLAVLQALRQRRTDLNARILVLCFNANLAEQIRSRMLPADAKIDVAHFHGLCEEATPPGTPRTKDYYHSECVTYLLQGRSRGDVRGYDHILVDEAQDFDSTWIDAVEQLLVNPTEGSLWCFFDPMQDIYRVGNNLKARFGEPFPLTINWRNTKSICEFVRNLDSSRLGELTPAEAALIGVPPEYHPYHDRQEELRLLEALVIDLLNKDELLPGQILLLSPYRRENTCLAGCSRLAGLRLVDFGLRHTVHKETRILFYETIPSFKGCEAECVLLHDIEGGGPAVDVTSLYVACSRPRVALHIFHDYRFSGPFPLLR